TATDITNWNDAYAHISHTNNPHSVTKAQVGLGNVDNTSDANKPLSTAATDSINMLKGMIEKLNFPRMQVSGEITLSATHIYKRLYNLGAAAQIVNIPLDFTDMEIGDQIIIQAIGGDLDLKAPSGVLVNGVDANGDKVASPYAARVLEKMAANEYILYIN